ncbi:FAD-binding protein [Andreprevotia chitinilytica]|uniref:FAD-binding protein n=1 Tax=Andreprevotia chitinilytica TaxID=396808 RepID=UPI00055599E9|nr:FAD-binding protein [Andreprevotia chitinilytica]
MSKILVLAEHDGHQLKIASRQAVTAAQAFNGGVDLLVVGADTAAVAASAAQVAGVARVLRADAAHLAHPLAEDVAALVLSIAGEYDVILAGHSHFSKNVLPRVAALLDVAMPSDVIEIQANNTYVRPIYAGNALLTIQSQDPKQVLTVRGTRFKAAVAGANVSGAVAEIATVAVPAATGAARWVSEEKNVGDRPELGEAPVVVSGGRSLGERFEEVLGPLADKLHGALGATRAAVDAGFAPNDLQVGQTGTIVAPDLYIAVGVSGAAQHLAGIKDSKVIVAINHDPDAPIFNVADYGLVADLFETIPALVKALG